MKKNELLEAWLESWDRTHNSGETAAFNGPQFPREYLGLSFTASTPPSTTKRMMSSNISGSDVQTGTAAFIRP
jgi:hypothetical protein